jgi:hypothetical protein
LCLNEKINNPGNRVIPSFNRKIKNHADFKYYNTNLPTLIIDGKKPGNSVLRFYQISKFLPIYVIDDADIK